MDPKNLLLALLILPRRATAAHYKTRSQIYTKSAIAPTELLNATPPERFNVPVI
jgi:hypothetical protein